MVQVWKINIEKDTNKNDAKKMLKKYELNEQKKRNEKHGKNNQQRDLQK